MTLAPIAYGETSGLFRTPGGRPVTMTYRHETNDYNTLNASLNADEYALPRGLSGVAVDVGGYLGSVAIGLALDNPGLRVIVIEPVPDNGDLIERNIAQNGLTERVTLIRGAVGSGGESVDVWYRYRGTMSAEHHAFVGNSSLAYDHGGELQHETISYEAISLPDLIAAYGPIAWMKVDTEGAEWAFLDTFAVKDVHTIVGEAHAVRARQGQHIAALLGATHTVELFGDIEGTCEFRAVRK